MFFVPFLVGSMFLFFIARTHVVAREIPPGFGRYTATFGIVYPYALLMVMAKLNHLKLKEQTKLVTENHNSTSNQGRLLIKTKIYTFRQWNFQQGGSITNNINDTYTKLF
jgi:hypothetical protein